jgi:di/tricarboxylate transporter/CRP-like cAMP-binding protein
MQPDRTGGGRAARMPAGQSGAASRTDHAGYARILGQVHLFAGLDRVALARLAAHLEPVSCADQAVIFRQDDPGDAFYLVATGHIGIYRADPVGDGDSRIRTIGPGEPFGEMALLTNRSRTATAKCETDCELLRLERSAFLNLVREQPSVALAIAATLSRRLADMLDNAEAADPAEPSAKPDAVAPGEAAAAAPQHRRRWRLPRAGLAALIAIAVIAAGWSLPPPAGLDATAWHALVILLAVLPALALDALLEGVLALLLATAWILSDVATPEIALAGFATRNWVLVVCVLVIGAAITSTGLLYRLALETIARMRGGFAGEVAALSIAGLMVGPAVPNATSRVIIISPMLTELVEALGYRPGSRAAAGLSMAALIGFGQMAAAFLTSSTTAVLVSAVLPEGTRNEVNWVSWALYGAPLNVVLFIGLVGSICWLYAPRGEVRAGRAARAGSLALQRALLGPISGNEKIVLLTGLCLLAGFVSEPLHGVHPAWIAVIAVAVLTAAGIVNVNSLRAVNWNFALLFGVLISLATVFAQTGLDRWMAALIASVIGGLAAAPILFLVALAGLSIAVSFLVRWQAAAPLITIALAPVAADAGIHPFIVGLIAVVAGNGFFLPYQSTTYLALAAGTDGKLFSHAQARPAALAYGLWTLLAVALAVPAWRLMGLI